MKKINLIISLCGIIFLLCSCATAPSNAVSSELQNLNTDSLYKEYNALDLTPVVPESKDFLVKTAAKLIPNTIKKNQNKLSTEKKAENRYSLLVETGKNYVMYANAFIQHNAQLLPMERYDEQYAELVRAKAFYLRGRDLILDALEFKYPGITQGLFSVDENEMLSATKRITAEDVETVYWLCAGWLGSFSLDPLDSNLLSTAPAAMYMLEYATELEPNYDNGAIWDVLCAYYAAAPAEMGGDKEKAVYANQMAHSVSGGNAIGPYITYAQSICTPNNDADGFMKSLEKAISVKKPSGTTAGVAYTISKEKALFLMEHKDDYFLDW